MNIKKLLSESAAIGREYQHLEDLLIVNGSKGGIEALNELDDAVRDPGTMDLKWDGEAAVFWGRDDKGQFIFVPKNQWSKKQLLNKDGLNYEIRNTGRPTSRQNAEQFAAIRLGMAEKYDTLWDIFERATPANFRGYLNGDLMFTKAQFPNKNDEYVFTPNKVTYTVASTGLNNKIKSAHVFVVVHGKINKFGADAVGNITAVSNSVADDFNKSAELIVLNTQQPKVAIGPTHTAINQSIQFINTHASEIDEIANYTSLRFTTLKQILYTYAIARSKTLSAGDFAQWLQTSKVSDNQKNILQEIINKPSWQIFWAAFYQILEVKHVILDQLHNAIDEEMQRRLGIRASINGKIGGEGMVKRLKSGSLGKLVNPAFRLALNNSRFTNEV